MSFWIMMSLSNHTTQRNRGFYTQTNTTNWRRPVSNQDISPKPSSHKNSHYTSYKATNFATPKNSLLKKTLREIPSRIRKTLGSAKFALPAKTQRVIMNLYPFVASVLAIVFIPLNLIRSFQNILNPLVFLGSLGLAVGFGLIALSINGLFKKYRGAWKLNLYGSIAASPGLLSLSETSDKVVFGVLLCIFWYCLFQLESKYKI
jgi:hypothetical protein